MNTTLIFLLLFVTFVKAQKLQSVCLKPITKPKILGIYTCECLFENSPEWGEQVLIVNCAELELQNVDFPVTTLPAEVISLDLSYNLLTKVPILNAESAKYLDLSYNQIDALNDYDFVKLKNLVHLSLAGNKVKTIAANAFFGLTNLRQLDLENNKVAQLAQNVFGPMANLYHLILSGNHELGPALAQVGVDFYTYLGTNPNLEILEVTRCNLTSINVARGGGLKTLYLAHNNLTDLSELPFALDTLDISDNAMKELNEGFFPKLTFLKLLLVQDMPELVAVKENSLATLSELNHLSFRGSMKLQHFDSGAFGDPETVQLNLDILNLQGTNISNFNQSMEKIVSKVKFHLEGFLKILATTLRKMYPKNRILTV